MASRSGESDHASAKASFRAPDASIRNLDDTQDWSRDLVQHSRDLLCIHDLQGRLISVNPEPARLLGYDVEEILLKPMREFVAPEFRWAFDEYLKNILRDGEASGLLTVLTRAGERRIWEYHNTLRTEGVRAPVVRGMAHDVTEQRRVERELRSSEERYRSVIAAMSEGVVLVDADDRLIASNPSAEKILGLRPEQLSGTSTTTRDWEPYTIHEDGSPFLPADYPPTVTLRTGEPQANVCMGVRPPKGELRWLLINSQPLRRSNERAPYAAVVSFTDVTERKAAEEALRNSNVKLAESVSAQERTLEELKLFRSLLDRSNDVIFVIDSKTLRFLDVNERACKTLGYSREELLAMTIFDIDTIIDDNVVARVSRELGNQGFASMETVHRRKDGTTFPVEVNMRRVDIDDIDMEYGVAVARDITERKRIEEGLKQSEEQIRLFIEHAPAALAMFDNEMRYLHVSRRWRTDFGLGDRDLRGKSHYEVFPDIPERWKEAHRRGLAGEVLRADNERFERADGTVQYIRWEIRPWHAATGKVGGIVLFSEDLTERRHAEEALRRSEAELREAQRVGRMGNWYRDLKTDALVWSEQLYRLFGLDPQSPTPSKRELERLYTDESWKRVLEANERLVSTGESDELEVEIKRPDGTTAWAVVHGEAVRNDTGDVIGIRGVALDITERKRTEEALRASKAELQEAQRVAVMGSWRLDIKTQTVYASEELFRITGQEPNPSGIPFEELGRFFPPETWRRIRQANDHAAKIGQAQDMEIAFCRGDGTQGWLLARGHADQDESGNLVGMHGIAIDITERKRVEEALRQSEAELREAQRVGQIGSWYRDLQTDSLVWSEQLYRLFQREPDKPLPSSEEFQNIYTPESWKKIVEAREYMVREGKPVEFEVGIRRPNETTVWGLLHGEPVRDENNQVVAVRGVIQDVTDRKRAEEALRQSEERFRIALTNSPIKVYNQDLDLRYTWVYNPPEGWTPEDYLGKTEEEVFGAEDGGRLRALKQKVLDTGVSARQELTLCARGRDYFCDVTVEPLRDTSGKIVGVTCACVDLTHLHRITEELRQAKEKLTEEKLYLEQTINTEMGFEEIIGKSDALKAVMEQSAKVAASDATVLLLGETGVGKELIARAIHRLSNRKANTFVKMNCAAIPSGLLESELFGAEKGAYTGSVSRKIGRLELADKGTIFLDEIGEIALALQPKLLRVLQDQEFERLGGTRTLKVDFRLIAATNRDLAECVLRNEFRRDLYYRLNVFPIRIPPLRERPEDIPPLVEHFVQKCARRMNKIISSIPKRTLDALIAWNWPGNVRELENFIERSVILTHGSVLAAPLSELRVTMNSRHDETLATAERTLILRALRESRGKISGERGAAARLGLKRTTLQSKLKTMGIDPRRPEA